MEKQELAELDEKFRNLILPHLDGKDSEDYDLMFEWQKFIYDKSQRVRTPERKQKTATGYRRQVGSSVSPALEI